MARLLTGAYEQRHRLETGAAPAVGKEGGQGAPALVAVVVLARGHPAGGPEAACPGRAAPGRSVGASRGPGAAEWRRLGSDLTRHGKIRNFVTFLSK